MTKPELIIQMRRVSDAMQELASEMIAYGVDSDDDMFHQHGIRLHGIVMSLSVWQSAAEKEENVR